MMLPQENAYQKIDNTVTLQLKLQPELFWFKGHFPGKAILPGVAQLSFVLHYAKFYLGCDLSFQGIDVMKFQRPLFPNEDVELSISWYPEKSKLHFQFSCQGMPASSGRVVLVF